MLRLRTTLPVQLLSRRLAVSVPYVDTTFPSAGVSKGTLGGRARLLVSKPACTLFINNWLVLNFSRIPPALRGPLTSGPTPRQEQRATVGERKKGREDGGTHEGGKGRASLTLAARCWRWARLNSLHNTRSQAPQTHRQLHYTSGSTPHNSAPAAHTPLTD